MCFLSDLDCTQVDGPSGFYDIQIGDQVVSAYCDVDQQGGGWMVRNHLPNTHFTSR